MVSSLTQRPSIAPSGAFMEEAFVLRELEDGDKWSCPYEVKTLDEEIDTFELRLPILLENGEMIDFRQTMTFRHRPITDVEKSAYLAMSIEKYPAQKPGLPPEDLGWKKYPVWTALGVGCGGLATCGAVANPDNQSDVKKMGGVVPAAIFFGLASSGICGGVGFCVDYITWKPHKKDTQEYNARLQKSQAYEKLKEKYPLDPGAGGQGQTF